ncbi:MAG: DUF4266 domain-containing protein [Methylococcales bacterium]|nr:DUF4266 domain-containing protein [Methylococcales bacterium]
MNRIFRARLALLIIFTASIYGCASVAPWERGTLAKQQMALDATPMQSVMRVHHYSSREAAAGGHSSGGGGCGCY